MRPLGWNSKIYGNQVYTPVYGIYSDGTAYCVLPHVHTNPTKGRIEFDMTRLDGYVIYQKNICGCTTNDSYALLDNYYAGTNGLSVQLYSTKPIIFDDNIDTSPNIRHTYIGIRDGLNEQFIYDGSIKSTTDSSNMTLGRLGIFTQNDFGPGDGVRPMNNRVPSKVALHFFKYWDGDDMIANLVPCIENQSKEVCFYNLVDDTFVKNIAGSGRFNSYDEIDSVITPP